MSEFTQALGLIAPYYNLAFVFVAVILFIKLFRIYKETRIGYIKPWVFVFLAMCVYIAEAVFTVVRSAGIFHLPHHVNGYFELIIISLFIYALLLKREQIKSGDLPGVFSTKLPPVPQKVKKVEKKSPSKKPGASKKAVRSVKKKTTKRRKSSSKKSSKKKRSSKRRSKR